MNTEYDTCDKWTEKTLLTTDKWTLNTIQVISEQRRLYLPQISEHWIHTTDKCTLNTLNTGDKWTDNTLLTTDKWTLNTLNTGDKWTDNTLLTTDKWTLGSTDWNRLTLLKISTCLSRKTADMMLFIIHNDTPSILIDSLEQNIIFVKIKRNGHLNLLMCKEERNVLFNDTLNTFYLRLNGIGHMVKDHSDSERGNQLLPIHGLLFLNSSKGSFICTIPQTGQYIPQPLSY